MRTARTLLSLRSARQRWRPSETPRGPIVLLQGSCRYNNKATKHGFQAGHFRQLHVFPSPFHRHNQDSDTFATARPPRHIPLPPAATSKQKPRDKRPPASSNVEASEALERSRELGTADGGPIGSTSGLAEVIKTHVAAQRWMQQRIWGALTKRQWPLYERLLSNYWRCGLNYDEVTYTLKLHGYILCHRQKPEKALLVLEEMKAAGMHPAIIRLNEGIVISQMELQDIFCALPADAYQNLCRLAFHAAIKLQRQRRIRLREYLLSTPPDKLFALTYRDVVALLDAQERALCFPDETLALVEANNWSNFPFLEGNETLMRAVNDALGLETTVEPVELLEGAQDEASRCEDVAALLMPVPKLHGREDLEPATWEQEHFGDEEAPSTKARHTESNSYEDTLAVSAAGSSKAPNAGLAAARAMSCSSEPAAASIGKSDLRSIRRSNEPNPTRLLQWKARPPC